MELDLTPQDRSNKHDTAELYHHNQERSCEPVSFGTASVVGRSSRFTRAFFRARIRGGGKPKDERVKGLLTAAITNRGT